MTIVCYKDGTLAADTAIWNGDTLTGHATKIVKNRHNYLVGATGDYPICQDFISWVEEHLGDIEELGDFPVPDEGADIAGIIISPEDIVTHYDGNGYPIVGIVSPYYAEGLGADMAIGAMAAGATAEQAVQICIDHLARVGGSVDTVRLGNQ